MRSGFRFYGPGDGAGLWGRPEYSALTSGPVTASDLEKNPGFALEGRIPGPGGTLLLAGLCRKSSKHFQEVSFDFRRL